MPGRVIRGLGGCRFRALAEPGGFMRLELALI